MLSEIIFLTIVQAFVTASKVSYLNHTVYRITCETPEQIEYIRNLELSDGLNNVVQASTFNQQYSLWREPDEQTHTADLMVPPPQMIFLTSAIARKIKYEVYIKDVQKLIDTENPKIRKAGFGWTRYHTLNEIYIWLDLISAKYPGKVQVIEGGKSYEGRPIKGVKLQFGKKSKPGVFIEGGIHAREWISPATVTYLVNEFLTSNNTETRKLAEAYDWYVFPSVNPDGYVYSHEKNRMWRKTRSLTSSSKCIGVDLNRNWDFKWRHSPAQMHPCLETYPGQNAFSEIEAKMLAKYMKSIRHKIFAFICFHSYSQVIMFPYGYTKKHVENYDELSHMGKQAVKALLKRHGTVYKSGSIPEVLSVVTGTSLDWARGALNISRVFGYELRDKGRYGFLLPADQIIPNGEEVLDSLHALLKTSDKIGKYSINSSIRSTAQVLRETVAVIIGNLFLLYFVF